MSGVRASPPVHKIKQWPQNVATVLFYKANLNMVNLMRILLVIIGTISLILGIVGIFLPLLPTTPFLLLSAALYFKSSPKLYDWLLGQKHLGPYIRNFREKKAIPLRAKIISITLMWGSMLYCVAYLVPIIWIKFLLIAIAIGVTYHILSYKTLKK